MPGAIEFATVVAEALREIAISTAVPIRSSLGWGIGGIQGWRIEVLEGEGTIQRAARRYLAAAREGQRDFVAVVWLPERANSKIRVMVSHDDLTDALDELTHRGMEPSRGDTGWIMRLRERGRAAYNIDGNYFLCRTKLEFGDWLTLLSRWRVYVMVPRRNRPVLQIVGRLPRTLGSAIKLKRDYNAVRDEIVENEVDEQLLRYGRPLVGSNMPAVELELMTALDDDSEGLSEDEITELDSIPADVLSSVFEEAETPKCGTAGKSLGRTKGVHETSSTKARPKK